MLALDFDFHKLILLQDGHPLRHFMWFLGSTLWGSGEKLQDFVQHHAVTTAGRKRNREQTWGFANFKAIIITYSAVFPNTRLAWRKPGSAKSPHALLHQLWDVLGQERLGSLAFHTATRQGSGLA